MKISLRPLRMAFALLCFASAATAACDIGSLIPQIKGGGQTGEAASSSGQKGGSRSTGSQSLATSQGSETEGLVCDASTDGIAWCDDDTNILFCADGAWWLLDCGAVEAGAFCGYDEDLNIVDCYVEEACAADDEACEIDDDCCGGYCADDGYCGDDGGGECVDSDGDCYDDSDCCSGSCNPIDALCD